MKKLILLFSAIIFLSACGMSLTIYSLNKGKLDIPAQESYLVVYEANFGTSLKANIFYTNSEGTTTKLKGIVGDWKQTVTLKSGMHVQLKAVAKGSKSEAHYKITVDGTTVNEHTLNAKKIDYSFKFDLP